MPNNDRDPILTVKAFLRAEGPGNPPGSSLAGVSEELEEIQARLARARRVEGRISLSEAIQALLAVGDSSVP